MVLRLASGSLLPSRAVRKRSLASTCTSGMLKWPRNSDTTSLASFSRSRPWSTKMQVSWSPTASWISTAATALSTPPERPQITRPLPTWARILAISLDRKCAMLQSPGSPAILRTKLPMSWAPRGVCATSGWNCTA